MNKWMVMGALLFGIGYAIASDTNPPVEEAVENPEPDQAVVPPEPEPDPEITDLHDSGQIEAPIAEEPKGE